MSSVIAYSSQWPFPRISSTVEHIVDPHPIFILSAFDYLKESLGEEYNQVLEQWILEIWCWHSFPRKDFFDTHPIQYYLGIDLMRWIDREDTFWQSFRKIQWWVDAFSFLQWLPDNSVPYCFLSLLDAYIMNGEGKRLSELLDRKVQNNIFVFDSAVRGNKVIKFS